MSDLSGVCTPEEYKIIHAKWQRISRFGLVPFVFVVGSTFFLLLSTFSVAGTWLALRAHHIKYSWSVELKPWPLALWAGSLVMSFANPLVYWFAAKWRVIRYQPRFGNPPVDQQL